MKQLYIAIATLLFIAGCKKDDFPVPPASTVAKFTYTINNNGFAPATVFFTNTSIVPAEVGTVSYVWNFGDTTTSTDESPSHVYTNPGSYTVTLTASTSVSMEVKTMTATIVIKDPNATGRPIYFTDGNQVFYGLVNSFTPAFSSIASGLQDSYGLALDTVNNKLYISDYDAGKIYQSDINGSNQIVFRTGLDGPDGLAIDYQSNKIYWDVTDGIERADINNPDINQKETFVTGQANDPEGICIDQNTHVLYWVNYNGGVWKKNLDGTGEALLIPTTGGGGSITTYNNKIYYDDYVSSGNINLHSANTDGTGVALVATGISRVVYGLAFEVSTQKIYWGDRNTGVIKRADPDGSNVESWYTAAGSSPRGIVFGKSL